MKTEKKRRPATVALDLSLAGRAAAVAVDSRGALAAWAVVSQGESPVGLARQALRELQVRPKEVRVLLGAEDVQVAVLDHPGAPDLRANVASGRGGSGRAGGGSTRPGATTSPNSGRVEPPTCRPDPPLLEALGPKSAPTGAPGEGEILAALFADGYPRLSEPSVAALATSPGTWLVAACGAAVIEPLAAGLLGESGMEPAFVVDQLLAEEGLKAGSALIETGEPLPAACALAWRLALRPTVTRLASPRSERRRASLAWARRTIHVAMILAVLGVLAMAAGLRQAWGSRGRTQALVAQAAGDARLLRELRETGALAGEAKRLQAELAGRTAPWPRVAEAVASLARTAPAETAWGRLQIKEGALEIEASAAGSEPEARLGLLRQALERSPGLANLSWGAPTTDRKNPRLHQVFRAAVRVP